MGVTDTAWAEVTDVVRFTGIEVTEDELLRAQDIIEMFCGATIASSNNQVISAGNENKLTRAVCYQAAWMQDRPDLYTHMDVDSISQDGQSQTPSHVNAALLAPLAKRQLDRLSWTYAPLRVRRRYGQLDGLEPVAGGLDSAAADDSRDWVPM